MGSGFEALQERVAGLSDAEILEALAAQDDLVEEAVAIYREEAARRALEPGEEEDEVAALAAGETPADGLGEETEAVAPFAHLAGDANVGEFTAADREVECPHCANHRFLAHEVLLSLTPGSPAAVSLGLPATLLRCSNCGYLVFFGEPEG
ncbi:MAG: hypothetical protein V1750_01410 [Acidobacteriota bacterium]